jgi:hypothetical protein
MTRAETSSPKRGNEFLLSVEPDKLGQREREREREREKREKEREPVSQSVRAFFPWTTHRGPRESTARHRAAGTKGVECVEV